MNFIDYLESKTKKDSVALFPGKFKPPHHGHLHSVKEALKKADKVIIYISPKDQEGIDKTWTVEGSRAIWKKLLSGTSNVEVRIASFPSPVTTVYNFLETEDIKNKTVYLIKSSKDEGDIRFTDSAIEKSLAKNKSGSGASVKELVVAPLGGDKPLSSSDIRKLNKEDRIVIDPLYEAASLHTSHAEDLLFEKGFRGYMEAIRNIYGALNILSGKKSSLSLSEKIDGRVAIFFGQDPDDGKAFVGNKSAFAKNAKKAKTDKDIDAMYGGKGDLPATLKKVLKKLAPTVKGAMYQGDLLWGSTSDLKKTPTGYSFTPNTITYSIDEPSLPDLGIAVHTKYTGGWDSLSPTNNFTVDSLRKSGYFILDPKIKNAKSDIDEKEIKEELKDILRKSAGFKKVQTLLEDEVVQELLPIWINGKVRAGSQELKDSDWENFITFVKDRYEKKIAELKSEKGKAKWLADMNSVIKRMTVDKKIIIPFFNSYNRFIALKNKILKALEGKEQLKGSISGKKTGEGWVLLSKGGKFVKLVDRAEFSRANFEISKNRREVK